MRNKQHQLQMVRLTHWLLKHWLPIFIALFGLFNLLPFLAPVAMKLGIDPLANAIYVMYTPLCHQMAQRSFFLFGNQLMYAPDQLPLDLTTNLTHNMLTLKQFSGSAALGWKVAWSDRMVYMYGATWLAALVYAWQRRSWRARRLPIGLFVLLMLPMAVDGLTHTISDFSGGLFSGFRYENGWLVQLTNGTLPGWFYQGDRLGSFNAWMRFISGLGFGVAIVWLVFPLIDREMGYSQRVLAEKLRRNQANLEHIAATTRE